MNVKRLSLHTSLDRELLGSKGKARRQSIGGQPPVPNPMSFPLDPNSYRAIVDFSMKPPKKSATHIGSATLTLTVLPRWRSRMLKALGSAAQHTQI